MLSLRQWGEKWELRCVSDPVLCDARDGMPIAAIGIHAHDGRLLPHDGLKWRTRAEVNADAASNKAAAAPKGMPAAVA